MCGGDNDMRDGRIHEVISNIINNLNIAMSALGERCPYCGTVPFKQEQIHGHYLCVDCRTVITGCCDGEAPE